MNNHWPDQVMIIAEAGSNHNGDLETARRLISTAAECGADVVKFQGFLTDELLSADSPYYDQMKALEVPKAWYPELIAHCEREGVKFLSTATNFTTLGWMEEFGASGYKVASCNISYQQLLDKLTDIGKPVIVSTGMASRDEISETAARFEARGLTDFAFLHCIAQYPTPAENMNLGNITELMSFLDCPIGLSDHSHGSHIPVAAITLGARIVEKHISLDKNGIGLDHEVAVLPDVFTEMCVQIREVEKALGSDFSPDLDTINQMRRSLRFAASLEAGHVIGEADLKVTRPEDGLLPKFMGDVIGQPLRRSVRIEEPLKWDHIK